MLIEIKKNFHDFHYNGNDDIIIKKQCARNLADIEF